MEIFNLDNRDRDKRLEGQRLKDYRNKAGFTYHQEGCSPWKHQGAAANNFQAGENQDKDVSDTEEHSNDWEN